MNCKDLEELLSAYADGELSRTQREFIEKHLSSCADCRETLVEFEAAGRQLSSLREVPATSDISKSTLSKIQAADVHTQKYRRRWLRPVTAAAAIIAVIAIVLVSQPWRMESSEAMAVSIVRSSPEVQAALNGEEIEEVEVTTKVVDEENNVLMMLVRTEERVVAAEVNLETKKVTEIVRVDVPDFQPGDEQKAIDIANTDPEVRELLAQGGIISEVHLTHSVDITQGIGPDGSIRKEGTGRTMALLPVEFDGQEWHIVIDLQEGTVLNVARSQPSSAMIVVHISRFVTRFVAPVLLFLGILLVSGLSFGYRRAKALAGTAALALGIVGLFMALYSLSSIWWRLVLSVGLPAIGLIIGIADIRQRVSRRWLPISGIIFSSLALLLVFLNKIMLNINNVPRENIVAVIGIAVVIAGIIAYALHEKIRVIPGKLLRPALVALAAVVVLIVALVQPWSVSPQGVIARAYSATEGLLSYRMSYSHVTRTADNETSELTTESEFSAPDRYHVKLTADGDVIEFVTAGGKQYVKSSNPSISASFAVASSSPSFLTREITLKILDGLTDLEELPVESIDGTDCRHYRGRADVEKQIAEIKNNIDSSDSHYERLMEEAEQMRSWITEVELWIGKEDYLIRQMLTDWQVPVEDTGRWRTSSVTVKYYDLNEPMTIEPPLDAEGNLLPGWRIDANSLRETFFDCRVNFKTTGEDPAHRRINAIVAVTNVATEAIARNVRVELYNSEVIKDGAETPWIKAVPSNSGRVVLKHGESETFNASWEYDVSHIADDELNELLGRTVIKIKYLTSEGDEAERMYTAGGAVYPSARPPAD